MNRAQSLVRASIPSSQLLSPKGATISSTLHSQHSPSTEIALSSCENVQELPSPGRPTLCALSYNVWFREDVCLIERMNALSSIVSLKKPDIIAFQEVTHGIHAILRQQAWWTVYMTPAPPSPPDVAYFTLLLYHKDRISVRYPMNQFPFPNSLQGRDLKTVTGMLADEGAKILVATTHLESPLGYKQLNVQARREQCERSLSHLEKAPKDAIILFMGDFNWNERDSGALPFPAGSLWLDAWELLHPLDPGYTYNAKENPMLHPRNRLQLRLDRVLCRLPEKWRVEHIELVGTEAIPNVKYEGRPVLPSDHFGLFAKFVKGEG